MFPHSSFYGWTYTESKRLVEGLDWNSPTDDRSLTFILTQFWSICQEMRRLARLQDDDQRSSHYDELLAAEARAQKKGVGLFSKKEPPIHRVADIAGVSMHCWFPEKLAALFCRLLSSCLPGFALTGNSRYFTDYFTKIPFIFLVAGAEHRLFGCATDCVCRLKLITGVWEGLASRVGVEPFSGDRAPVT